MLKLKILICAGIFPPDVGGPASYARKLALEMDKLGHQVNVVTYSDKKKIDDYYPFPVIRIVRSQFKPWHYLRYLSVILWRGLSADVLYAQDQVSAGYPAYLASKVLRKPFLIKVTGDYSWEQAFNRSFTTVLIDEFQKLTAHDPVISKIRKVQMKVVGSAMKVVVPSEYLKSLVKRWGLPETKISVIYNAVNLPETSETKAELRQRYSIAPDEFLIVSSGRDVKWKGFALVRKTVEELKQSYPDIRLLIFSDIPQKTLHEYFKAADLYVLNTGYEGLPNTLVEALSLGLPVVATNVCGNPEVIENGKTGLLVEYNNQQQFKDAIFKLYQDRAMRERFAAAGRAATGGEKFSFERMITETEKLLIEAAGK